MQTKVSVIIPVYNAEKYIGKCLDSVLSQTLSDIQIIVINDGSKDSSGEICRQYAAKFKNIEYFEQKNAGSAAARNAGLDRAAGEYVGFVDADDHIEPDMYEKLYTAAKENHDADIVFCRVFEDECRGAMDYIFPRAGYYDKEQIKTEILPYMFPSVTPKGNFRNIRWSNVMRLFKRRVIEEGKIRSCEGVRNFEDLGFLSECTLRAESYYYLPECLYHNFENPDSQSRNYVSDMWAGTKKLIAHMRGYTESYGDESVSSAFDMCVFWFCTMAVKNEARLRSELREEKIGEIVSDAVCKEALSKISCSGMNGEYTALYTYMKEQNAKALGVYLKKQAFKKKYIAPVLDRLFQNERLEKTYRKIRGR